MHEYSNTFGVQTPVSFLGGLKVVIGVIYGKFFFWGGGYMEKQHEKYELNCPNHHLSGCHPIIGNHQHGLVGIGPNAFCMLHEIAIEEILQGAQW